METKFTKGNWIVCETLGDDYDDKFLEVGAELDCGEKRFICESSFNMTSNTDDALPSFVEMESNFKLIAAAPEMYNALQSMLDSPYADLQDEDFEMIENVLAKARGDI